jgi:hypothetical protein
MTPTPTLTPSPTLTPTPTATEPNTTIFKATLRLNGIGSGGDSTNPTANSLSNKNPENKEILADILIYDQNKKLVQKKTETFIYTEGDQVYRGSANLGKNFESGEYLVIVQANKYLAKKVSATPIIIANGKESNPAIVSLVAGDANNDNVLDGADYNILIGCYSDYAPAVACTQAQFKQADFNDDGKVNQFDYNLLIREFKAAQGDSIETAATN